MLVLAGMTIFCSSCRVVAKPIHGNSCIGDLCYIKDELNDNRSTLFTDIVLTVLVLAGITIFCSSCRVVAKPIHGNSCIGDLCYIKVELNDSRSTLFTDIVLTVLVLAGIITFVVVVEWLPIKSMATVVLVTFVTSRLNLMIVEVLYSLILS